MVIAFCGVSKPPHFLLRHSYFSISSSNHANLQYFTLITNPVTPKSTLSLSPSSLHHHSQSFTPILSLLLSRECDSNTSFRSTNNPHIFANHEITYFACSFLLPQTTLLSSTPPSARFSQSSVTINTHPSLSNYPSMGPLFCHV